MSRNLRIIHVLRAPVGGLFRHVVDLACEQSKLGHEVGVIYDRSTESPAIASQLERLTSSCRLGLRSTPMPRLVHFNDISAFRAVSNFAQETKAQILHGHGAKGGAYARYAAARLRARKGAASDTMLGFYTPHGGSLHYSPKSVAGKIFLSIEKWLARKTSGVIFESAYSERIYHQVIGLGFCPSKVIANGLGKDDFQPAIARTGAADFLFVGELRTLKGVDVLLHALKETLRQWPDTGLAIVGDGPEMQDIETQTLDLELERAVTFYGRLPARDAFQLGRSIVVPSRLESFPYIVLEAGAAGLPLIATNVGGIHEITDGTPVQLIEADNVDALRDRMEDILSQPEAYARQAEQLQAHIQQKFRIEIMASQITDFYLSVMKR